jgi:hypothetical protein
MAEVVGVVVGVVSLGVQLAESLQKVKRFYDTVRDAPERLLERHSHGAGTRSHLEWWEHWAYHATLCRCMPESS